MGIYVECNYFSTEYPATSSTIINSTCVLASSLSQSGNFYPPIATKLVSTQQVRAGIYLEGETPRYVVVGNSSSIYGSIGISYLNASSAPTTSNINGWVLSNEYNGYYYVTLGIFSYSGQEQAMESTNQSLFDAIDSIMSGSISYPITYNANHCTLSGPEEAAIGDTVEVTVTPDTGYQMPLIPGNLIKLTNNGSPVNFSWDSTTSKITFTMPDPT